MKTLLVLLAAGFLLYLWLQSRRLHISDRGIAETRSDDAEMVAAIARARADFHLFVARLSAPETGDENFSIKVGVVHDGGTEHLWLSDVRVEGEQIAGLIANDPTWVPLKCGDAWQGTTASLSDWTYMSHGRMQGNFTLRAILPRLPKHQKEQVRAMLEERWDTRALVHLPWPRDSAFPGKPLPSDLSTGDPVLMDAVSAHLDRQLGKVGTVFHELVSPSAHIDLYPCAATAERPFHVIVTTGCAEATMQVPAERGADPWIELVLLLPPTWSLASRDWRDERQYWPFRWMKRLARHHYETGRWLGPGHLLVNGEPAAAIHESVAVDSALLMPPRGMPAGFDSVQLPDGRKVRLLMVCFLTPAEREQLVAQGFDAFLAALPSDRLSLPSTAAI